MEKIHGCLREDQKVLHECGCYIPISETKPGDRVICFDEVVKQFTASNVNEVIIQDVTDELDWYELTFDDGRILICTEDHPVLTARGWIIARDLFDTDNIIGIE